MSARLAVVVATLGLALGAIGCKVADPDYCESNVDCRAAGGNKTFCDIAGRFGAAHTCMLPRTDAGEGGAGGMAGEGGAGGEGGSGGGIGGAGGGPGGSGGSGGGGSGGADGGDAPDVPPDLPPDLPPDMPPDLAPECMTSTDCTSASKPICVGGTCMGCTLSGQCATRNPTTTAKACDTGSGQCVECASAPDCNFDPNKPICEAKTCRACKADAECSGPQLCEVATGHCLGDAEVIYVDVGNAACADGPGDPGSPSKPFCKIQRALDDSTSRIFVKVAAGKYSENVAIDVGGTARKRWVIGPPPTGSPIAMPPVELAAADTGLAALSIGGKLDLTLQSIKISGGGSGDGAMGDADADGITCGGGINRPRLALVGGSTIRAPKGDGIDASKCTVETDRLQVLSANLAGIKLVDCDFSIVNTVVGACGGTGISIGGASGTTHAIVNDTVADNIGTGVDCGFAQSVENSIVWGNGPTGGPPPPGWSGMCSFLYCDVQVSAPAGEGNYSADPIFRNRPGLDFHLGSAASGAKDKGATAATPNHDLDNELRSSDVKVIDTGADEFY